MLSRASASTTALIRSPTVSTLVKLRGFGMSGHSPVFEGGDSVLITPVLAKETKVLLEVVEEVEDRQASVSHL